MASNKSVKIAQLSKDMNLKGKSLLDMLAEMGIDKKTGASLDSDEMDLFLDTITRKNQIENLADYLSGKARIISEEKEQARIEAEAKAKAEAEAKKESARALAEAEVIRAEGVAKANSIIGESLRGNESYLRYLWIQTLNDNPQNVIYVPTEAGLPILEAGKRQSCRTDDKTDDL